MPASSIACAMNRDPAVARSLRQFVSMKGSAQRGGKDASSAHERNPLQALESFAVSLRCRRGQAICNDEAASEYWYRVISGVAKRYSERPSGRRQIVGLLLPGDFFGLPVHGQSAVEAAVNDTLVVCYPRHRVEMLADHNPAVGREMRKMSCETISRLQEQILILGRTSALKKVGSFLLMIARRFPNDGQSHILLPITRYDIAEYLGLSIETVSRALSELRRAEIIKCAGARRVNILNPAALEDGSRSASRFGGDE